MTKAYKVGDQGDPYIGKIQQALNEKLGAGGTLGMPDKAYLKLDNGFGPKLRDALMAYQKSVNITTSGVYDSSTAAFLDPYIASRYLKDADFTAAAASLQVEEAVVRAATEVESKGCGFFGNGKSQILFERHVFRKQLLAQMRSSTIVATGVARILGVGVPVTGPNIDLIDQTMQAMNGDIYNEKAGGYQGGTAEYGRMEKASTFSSQAAKCSASWGLFQIMGYHYSDLGYKTVDDMVSAAQLSESSHLKDFAKFISINPKIHNALKSHDWLTYAVGYNGAGQQGYDQRMAAAYTKYKK